MFDRTLWKTIADTGVVAVLIIDDPDDAVPVAENLLKGGIRAMELTLRTDAAFDALRAVKAAVPDMLAGVGTILTTQQVSQVKQIGVDFGVSPGLNPRVVKAAESADLNFAPGISTPSDIERAVELGCRLLKFFPAESAGGLKHLQSMAAPYNHLGLEYIPLGGINLGNMTDYLSTPLVPAVGGSWIAPRDLIHNKDWDGIAANARRAFETFKAIGGQ